MRSHDGRVDAAIRRLVQIHVSSHGAYRLLSSVKRIGPSQDNWKPFCERSLRKREEEAILPILIRLGQLPNAGRCYGERDMQRREI